MLEQTIASLAILKVNSDRGIDYIQNFVPFVAECVRMSDNDVISTDTLQADIRREFGLRIPLVLTVYPKSRDLPTMEA